MGIIIIILMPHNISISHLAAVISITPHTARPVTHRLLRHIFFTSRRSHSHSLSLLTIPHIMPLFPFLRPEITRPRLRHPSHRLPLPRPMHGAHTSCRPY
jgi:hypothetical protein